MSIKKFVESKLFEFNDHSELIKTPFDKLPIIFQRYVLISGKYEGLSKEETIAQWNEFNEEINETWIHDAEAEGILESLVDTTRMVQNYLDTAENPSWDDFHKQHPDVEQWEYEAGQKAYQEV